MRPLFLTLLLLIYLPLHARDIAKDINELHVIDTFNCKTSQSVEYKSGNKRMHSGSQFRIPVSPGGYMKLHSSKLNLIFEAYFSEGVHFSLKQLSAMKAFPYKMNKKTDKKTFVNVEIMGNTKKPVFTMNCKRH